MTASRSRLEAGEIRGLIGPNGAGKTTFVNLVTGIEIPDSGEVKLGAATITSLGPHQIAAHGLVRRSRWRACSAI